MVLLIVTVNGLIFNYANFILVVFDIVALIITLNGLMYNSATFIIVAFNIVALKLWC